MTDPKTPPHSREVHRTIRTLSFGTLWRMLRYPFILLSLAVIPRMMGDTDYGVYAYFISLFVLLNTVTDLGFLQVFGMFVPESEAEGDRNATSGLLRGLLAFGILLSMLMAAGAAITYRIAPWPDLSFEWVLILGLLLVMHRIEAIFFNFMYGLNHIARFSAKEMLRSALTLVLVILLYRSYGLTGAFWGLFVNELILVALGGYWIRGYLSEWRGGLSLRFLSPRILFGIRFFVPALLLGLLQRAGNVFVKTWAGPPEEVAYYDIANQYLILTTMFIGLILQTLLPSLAKLKATNQDEAMRRWQRVVLAYCGILAFLAVNALMWLGEPVILYWLGESFRPVVDSARWISAAIPPSVVAYAGMNLALLDKKSRAPTAAVGVGIGLMTCASFLLIPDRGATGASTATVLGYWAMGTVFFVQYRRRFIEILGPFGLSFGVALPFCLLYLLRFTFPGSLLMFGLTSAAYLGILTLLGVISIRDIRKLIHPLTRSTPRDSHP